MVGLEAHNMVIKHQDFEAELTNDGQNEKNKTSRNHDKIPLREILNTSIFLYLSKWDH